MDIETLFSNFVRGRRKNRVSHIINALKIPVSVTFICFHLN